MPQREKRTFQARWQESLTQRLAHLRSSRQAELWRRLGLTEPLPVEELVAWVAARAAEQSQRGDRYLLYLPERLAVSERMRQQDAASEAELLAAIKDPRVLPIRERVRRFYVEAFAGCYPPDGPGSWPGPFWGKKVQPLALVAVAVAEAQRMTGCDPEDGLLFMLCDVPCGDSPLRASFLFGGGGGLTLWTYDPLLPAETLAREYAAMRRRFISRMRPKRPEAHTLELIELVWEMRPQAGRHPSNASWSEVLRRWNDSHTRKRYADEASISRAYAQALRCRQALGLLPKEGA